MHIPLLTILLTRQWGRSTCVPAVFHLVTHTLTDERFTEAEACELLGTVHGEGTDLGAMTSMLRMSLPSKLAIHWSTGRGTRLDRSSTCYAREAGASRSPGQGVSCR